MDVITLPDRMMIKFETLNWILHEWIDLNGKMPWKIYLIIIISKFDLY